MSKLYATERFELHAMPVQTQPGWVKLRVKTDNLNFVEFVTQTADLIKLSRKLLALCNSVDHPPQGKRTPIP